MGSDDGLYYDFSGISAKVDFNGFFYFFFFFFFSGGETLEFGWNDLTFYITMNYHMCESIICESGYIDISTDPNLYFTINTVFDPSGGNLFFNATSVDIDGGNLRRKRRVREKKDMLIKK